MNENEIYIEEDRTSIPIVYRGKCSIKDKEYTIDVSLEDFYILINALRTRLNIENDEERIDYPVHFSVHE